MNSKNENLSGKAEGWVGGRPWGTSQSILLLCGLGRVGADVIAEEGHGGMWLGQR